MIAAKNRLFKLLSLDSIRRNMGLAAVSIDLREIMDSGKVLLVNLKRSKYLSHEGAKTFGSLLVNQFFEAALDRQPPQPGADPNPYYLYMDEFQNFVSLDITRMLAEVRKFGLFLIMAHQYFEQLDEQVTAAAMNNCQIKAVFGGLAVRDNAERMAKELFMGQLDPYKVMAAIYQTKFWPVYDRDQVYTHGRSHGTSRSRGSTTGGGEHSAATTSTGSSEAFFYDDWFSLPQLAGTRTETTSRGSASMSSRSSNWAESITDSDNDTESESVADLPIYRPIPYEELSSEQFMPMDTQLMLLTAALKLQFQRHCFIQIGQQETQPMLVPKVEDVFVTPTNLQSWQEKALAKFNALPAVEVDNLIAAQETALLQAATTTINARPGYKSAPPLEEVPIGRKDVSQEELIWPGWRTGGTRPTDTKNPTEPSTDKQSNSPATPADDLGEEIPPRRRSGPAPDIENHAKVAEIIGRYGEAWDTDDNLYEVCEALDAAGVPVPDKWWKREDVRAQTWKTALLNNPRIVKKAIRDRLKAATKAKDS